MAQGETVPTYGGTVFISYAREDGDVARDLKKLLEEAGVSVWFDRNALRSGELWTEEIKKAIQDSKVFIPIISRHSARTEPRFAHKEWDLASGMGAKRICPLRTDLTAIPEQFAAAHSRDMTEMAADLRRPDIDSSWATSFRCLLPLGCLIRIRRWRTAS